jgi:hypothetical protein
MDMMAKDLDDLIEFVFPASALADPIGRKFFPKLDSAQA